jgi:Sec-independent protein secretion pathway component TatC
MFRNFFNIAVVAYLFVFVKELIYMQPELIIENRIYFSSLLILSIILFFIGNLFFDKFEENQLKGSNIDV